MPGWATASSVTAPVLLIGGWTVAAAVQEGGFDPAAETISALAAQGATDRWLMTAALAGLGACHVITALGLRPAALSGRIVLAVGGLATIAVAAFPLDAGGESTPHAVAAGIAFLALAVWPAVAVPRAAVAPERRVPWGLRPIVARVATAVLLGLVVWFALSLGGPRVGLAERVAAGAQACWPLAVVMSVRAEWGRRLRTVSPASPATRRPGPG